MAIDMHSQLVVSSNLELFEQSETLRLVVEKDDVSGLPLFSEAQNIFNLITAYVRLPYIIAEYGCGKRCSIILKQLVELGLAPHCLSRGLVMERDMSATALAETNHLQRPHALVVRNPMFDHVDLNNAAIVKHLESVGAKVDLQKSIIKMGNYVLHHTPRVDFSIARSHVFVVISFWDPQSQTVKQRVLDPTLDEFEPFPLQHLRRKVNAFESVIFMANITERFKLQSDFLTRQQERDLLSILGSQSFESLEEQQEMDTVRQFLSAEPGSIGDPQTWTYANNIKGYQDEHVADVNHHQQQVTITRSAPGKKITEVSEELIESRLDSSVPTSEMKDIYKKLTRLQLAELPPEEQANNSTARSQIALIAEDALWSERHLAPLSSIANAIALYHSLTIFHHQVLSGYDPRNWLDDNQMLFVLKGISGRLRYRLDLLADVSKNELGQIDAQTFSQEFIRASVELIKQMNEAGLSVFIDAVGSIHGLFLPEDSVDEFKEHTEKLAEFCNNSLCFMSHIDTVNNAGKYDGRLGVLSGIETVSLLRSVFSKKRNQDLQNLLKNSPIMVSAYINEEMTYTGSGVSMPGSAAVSGLASLEDVYSMQSARGETFKESLENYFLVLIQQCNKAKIPLAHGMIEGAKDLSLLLDPKLFFSPNTYERHIEQGPVLDRAKTPMVLVHSIRGIFQEDLSFVGENATRAAFSLNEQLRRLTLEYDSNDELLRITLGRFIESDYNPPTSCLSQEVVFIGEANHAGATPRIDRRDAGIAAARYVSYLESELKKQTGTSSPLVLIGDVSFIPGAGRNSLAGEAIIKIACPDSIAKTKWSEALRSTRVFVENILSENVVNGGEGIKGWREEPKEELRIAKKALVSIDVRYTNNEDLKYYKVQLQKICDQLSRKYEVSVNRKEEQLASPITLAEKGQILQLERSYGGSHNPYEAMLLEDTLRGSIVQFMLAYNWLQDQKDKKNSNLFERTKKLLLRAWQQKIPQFSSGALHDSGNIARGCGS